LGDLIIIWHNVPHLWIWHFIHMERTTVDMVNFRGGG
jgi:hypothetical protein